MGEGGRVTAVGRRKRRRSAEREAEVRRYRSGVCGRLTRVMAASPGAGENERKESERRTPAAVRSRGIRERKREGAVAAAATWRRVARGVARRRRWRRTTRGPPSGWLAGRVAGRGPREKDIKVRNSQRGERAPPRHRLDRGSLIPLLECSPPPSYSTTTSSSYSSATFNHPLAHHPPPPTQESPRPPTSTYSVELESPRVRALHTHSRAYVSSCPAAGAATAATVAKRRERDGNGG